MVEIANKMKRRATRRVYVTLKDSRKGVKAIGFTMQNMTAIQAEKFINRCVKQLQEKAGAA